MSKNNVAIIWTTKYCPYCYLTKELLKSNNISYIENQINDEYSKKLYFQNFPNNNNIIVPKIILNNNLIQGYNNLVSYLKEQKIYNREKTPYYFNKSKRRDLVQYEIYTCNFAYDFKCIIIYHRDYV